MHKHSIIIIKNEENDYGCRSGKCMGNEENEYLQYFDKKWNSYLFLNSKMNNKNDVESIYNKLKQMLEIEKEDISISFIGEKTHKKFSESAKIEKEYQHYFYKVKLLKNKEKFNQKEFECFDIKYKWFSFEEFQKDERIQKVNSDIIQFVKSFDV